MQNKISTASILWVGLSAVKTTNLLEKPLSANTNTGKLIKEIEDRLPEFNFYKTNAVKCLPLDSLGKIRYPALKEMESCFKNLQLELKEVKPMIVILLGAQVSNFFLKQFQQPSILLNKDFCYSLTKVENFYILPIHHPSYIQIYKQSMRSQYKDSVLKIIQEVFTNNV